MLVSKLFKIPPQKLTKGEVGIEVEVEGKTLPKPDPKIWTTTTDGSLKAEEAYEYVLAKPMSVADASAALTYLDDLYTKTGSKVDESVRAGVHVHVNVQDLNIVQLYSFITLYLLLEELLVRWCGNTREGNLFCLRAGDAEWLLKMLTKAVRTNDYHRLFANDDLRYASMNVKAIAEHGSLEFRSMRGTRHLGLVDQWMRMLMTVRAASLKFEHPIDVITGFSGLDKREFVLSVMGKEYGEELLNTPNADLLLFNGMRAAQDVAYATDNWPLLLSMGSSNPFKQGEISILPDPLEDQMPPMDDEVMAPQEAPRRATTAPRPVWATMPAHAGINMDVVAAREALRRVTAERERDRAREMNVAGARVGMRRDDMMDAWAVNPMIQGEIANNRVEPAPQRRN